MADNNLDLGQRDQQLHFAVAYGATVTGSVVGKELGVFAAPVMSGLLVMFAATVKEYTDPQKSNGDLKAGLAGTLTGMTFSFAF